MAFSGPIMGYAPYDYEYTVFRDNCEIPIYLNVNSLGDGTL